MNITERVRKLRSQAAEIEAEAVEQDKHDAYVAALERERAAAEAQLAHGRRLGDRRETIQGGGVLGTGVKTGKEIAAAAERAIADIDVELARVKG